MSQSCPSKSVVTRVFIYGRGDEIFQGLAARLVRKNIVHRLQYVYYYSLHRTLIQTTYEAHLLGTAKVARDFILAFFDTRRKKLSAPEYRLPDPVVAEYKRRIEEVAELASILSMIAVPPYRRPFGTEMKRYVIGAIVESMARRGEGVASIAEGFARNFSDFLKAALGIHQPRFLPSIESSISSIEHGSRHYSGAGRDREALGGAAALRKTIAILYSELVDNILYPPRPPRERGYSVRDGVGFAKWASSIARYKVIGGLIGTGVLVKDLLEELLWELGGTDEEAWIAATCILDDFRVIADSILVLLHSDVFAPVYPAMDVGKGRVSYYVLGWPYESIGSASLEIEDLMSIKETGLPCCILAGPPIPGKQQLLPQGIARGDSARVAKTLWRELSGGTLEKMLVTHQLVNMIVNSLVPAAFQIDTLTRLLVDINIGMRVDAQGLQDISESYPSWFFLTFSILNIIYAYIYSMDTVIAREVDARLDGRGEHAAKVLALIYFYLVAKALRSLSREIKGLVEKLAKEAEKRDKRVKAAVREVLGIAEKYSRAATSYAELLEKALLVLAEKAYGDKCRGEEGKCESLEEYFEYLASAGLVAPGLLSSLGIGRGGEHAPGEALSFEALTDQLVDKTVLSRQTGGEGSGERLYLFTGINTITDYILHSGIAPCKTRHPCKPPSGECYGTELLETFNCYARLALYSLQASTTPLTCPEGYVCGRSSIARILFTDCLERVAKSKLEAMGQPAQEKPLGLTPEDIVYLDVVVPVQGILKLTYHLPSISIIEHSSLTPGVEKPADLQLLLSLDAGPITKKQLEAMRKETRLFRVSGRGTIIHPSIVEKEFISFTPAPANEKAHPLAVRTLQRITSSGSKDPGFTATGNTMLAGHVAGIMLRYTLVAREKFMEKIAEKEIIGKKDIDLCALHALGAQLVALQNKEKDSQDSGAEETRGGCSPGRG